MPTREKLRAITKDLGSQARVARALGVSPSRVSRWLKAEDPDPENRVKVEGLEFVLSFLLSFLHPDTAVAWLTGHNGFLNDFQPIQYLARGRVGEVIDAARAFKAGSFH
ncbi:MAG: helix-turn-helix domain-containing protein [Actinomycetota bacterium]|nr:helix-turn-helix domain-containing protein [Actinomycetota bacterium]